MRAVVGEAERARALERLNLFLGDLENDLYWFA